MKLSVALLWVNCLLFMAFGLGFILIPEMPAALVTGAAPGTPSAVTDMRTTYGGMAFGFGGMFGLSVRNPRFVRLGVQGVLLTMAALSSGRLLGMALDGSPNVFMFILVGAELLMAGLAIGALRQLRDEGLLTSGVSRRPDAGASATHERL